MNTCLRFVLCVAPFLGLCHTAFGQTTTRVSLSSTGTQATSICGSGAIASTGRFIAFSSGGNDLVSGDTNNSNDVFLRDLQAGTLERVSLRWDGTQTFSGGSDDPSISADGRFVAFLSSASDLVLGDTNIATDIFVRDRLVATTLRVSVSSSGGQANSESLRASISADGGFVVFDSGATNLVTGDTNQVDDVFVHDMSSGATVRVSVNSSGIQGNSYSSDPCISSDGRFVAFQSFSTNLVTGDTNGAADIFVHDMLTGQTTRANLNSSGAQSFGGGLEPAISGDGRVVAFTSNATDLVAGDTNGYPDVYVHDRLSGTTERVSVGSNGAQANGASGRASLSYDGRFVCFQSMAGNLILSDTNGALDVFIHDRLTGQTTLLSASPVGNVGNAPSALAHPSADGRQVVFTSLAGNLVAGDTNGLSDVFVRDRGPEPPYLFCLGDGSGAACPCGNTGVKGRGCNNSIDTGGASLSATGESSLGADTLSLTSDSVIPGVWSILLQGTVRLPPSSFGGGLRCLGGHILRLYGETVGPGSVSAPGPGEPAVSLRSALLGFPIATGSTLVYQLYYREVDATFCPTLPGLAWNSSAALAVVWSL